MSEKEIELQSGSVGKVSQQQRPVIHHPDGPNVATDKPDNPGSIVDQLINTDPEELLQWEEIWLPSEGIYYSGRIPAGKVEIKPMGLIADKIMATGRLASTFQSIDWLFKHHVKFPSEFSPADLLTGDRTFILFCLRGITHGNNYEFSITCPNDDCKRKSVHEYDLNELQANIRKAKHMQEPVRVVLPGLTKNANKLGFNDEIWADVRFLRGSDTRALEERRRYYENLRGKTIKSARSTLKSDISLNQIIEDNIKMAIVGINGDGNKSKIEKIVRKMTQSDTAAIRRVIDKESPGIDTEIIIQCPHCDNSFETDLPITESFFRPEAVGGV